MMDPGPSTRQSSRTRVKSQRALESEDTNRILSAVKAQHDEIALTEAGAPASKRAKGVVKGKATRKGGKKGKDVRVENEVFCVCRKPSGEDDGPMIECEECNDWFHFACVGLDETTAADIVTYVCPPCQSNTGRAVGYGDDVLISDVENDEKASSSGKQSPSRSRSPQSTSSGGVSDAQPNTDSDDGSDVAPARKRTRLTSTTKPHSSATAQRHSVTRPSAVAAKLHASARKISTGSPGALPPARKFVVDRLATVVRGLFESIDDVAASAYAAEVEKAIFEGFKETKDGKDVAGVRYKAQFNLLSSSLPKARPDLRESIISGEIGATQVANLTSEDLASAERLEEIQAARRAALEQTVKVKSDQEPAAIRLGRDGFEKAEDMHEKELRALQEQEQAARRRESLKVEEAGQTASAVVGEEVPIDSPKVDSHETPLRPAAAPSPVVRRSVSIDVPATPRIDSPTAPVFKPSLTSAWSGAGTVEEPEDVQMPFEEYGQQELDLSDIIPEAEDDEEALTNEGHAAEPDSKPDAYGSLPVIWRGGIVNPAAPSPHVPPMQVKLVCTRPDSASIPWSLLLPHDPIAITGRVPTKNSLQFLNDSRLSPGKELLTVAFELEPQASDEERRAWVEIIEYHIGKDRHAIYLPYGNHPPPNAIKEVYLIPLRPEDSSPDVTDLIDGYCLPAKRVEAVWLGIFVANKQTTTTPPLPPASSSAAPVAAAPAVPASHAAPPVPAAPATFQNAQLQALMASLNPSALAALSSPNPGGASPGVPVYPAPPTGLMGPPPPSGPSTARPPYDGGAGYQAFIPPPPGDMGYRSPHDQYGRPPPPPRAHDGPRRFDEPRRDFRGRSGAGPRGRGGRPGGDSNRSPDRVNPRQSDSGWASRGRGR